MKIIQLVRSIALFMVLLCVILVFPGCTGTGDSIDSIAGLAKLVPHDAGLLIHMDAKQIKSDPDLGYLYDELNLSELPKMTDIDIDDIEKIGMVMLNNGGLAFLSGDFDTDVVRDKMIGQEYDKDVYKDMEIWLIESYSALTIHKGIIIFGDNDNIKDCIEIITGEKTSYYDNNEDTRDVIKKLPGGIIHVVMEEALYDNALTMGMSLNKADSNSLKIEGLFKFDNENDAKEAISDIKKDLGSDSDVSLVDVVQKQEYIEFSAKMDIEDWEWFW